MGPRYHPGLQLKHVGRAASGPRGVSAQHETCARKSRAVPDGFRRRRRCRGAPRRGDSTRRFVRVPGYGGVEWGCATTTRGSYRPSGRRRSQSRVPRALRAPLAEARASGAAKPHRQVVAWAIPRFGGCGCAGVCGNVASVAFLGGRAAIDPPPRCSRNIRQGHQPATNGRRFFAPPGRGPTATGNQERATWAGTKKENYVGRRSRAPRSNRGGLRAPRFFRVGGGVLGRYRGPVEERPPPQNETALRHERWDAAQGGATSRFRCRSVARRPRRSLRGEDTARTHEITGCRFNG